MTDNQIVIRTVFQHPEGDTAVAIPIRLVVCPVQILGTKTYEGISGIIHNLDQGADVKPSLGFGYPDVRGHRTTERSPIFVVNVDGASVVAACHGAGMRQRNVVRQLNRARPAAPTSSGGEPNQVGYVVG